MEQLKCHIYDLTDGGDSNILYNTNTTYDMEKTFQNDQKRHENVGFLKLKAMHHNIIIIQVLDSI